MSYRPRTIVAGELRSEHIGQQVLLNGWVDGVRDMGGVLFFDVRDRSGKSQCVVRPQANGTDLSNGTYETARKLRSEFVVAVGGLVKQRENPNPKLPTGEIEIEISDLAILNESQVPPFEVKEDTTANEDLRLKYRYLDLRRPSLQKNIATRHKIVKTIRDYFDERGFY